MSRWIPIKQTLRKSENSFEGTEAGSPLLRARSSTEEAFTSEEHHEGNPASNQILKLLPVSLFCLYPEDTNKYTFTFNMLTSIATIW